MQRLSLVLAASALLFAGASWAQPTGIPWNTIPSQSARFPAFDASTHTVNGVSQFQTGFLSDNSYPIKLHNPTEFEQVVSVLVYSNPNELCDTAAGGVDECQAEEGGASDEYDPEIFLGCLNVLLTPHAAAKIEDDYFHEDVIGPHTGVVLIHPDVDPKPEIIPNDGVDPIDFDERTYAEVLSAPTATSGLAQQRGWIANGFGVNAYSSRKAPFYLTNPRLFNLPEDPADAQRARDCMCEGACEAGNRFAWRGFGVLCNCP